jgi:hypothetical protein
MCDRLVFQKADRILLPQVPLYREKPFIRHILSGRNLKDKKNANVKNPNLKLFTVIKLLVIML